MRLESWLFDDFILFKSNTKTTLTNTSITVWFILTVFLLNSAKENNDPIAHLKLEINNVESGRSEINIMSLDPTQLKLLIHGKSESLIVLYCKFILHLNF